MFWMDLASGALSGLGVAVLLESYLRVRSRVVNRAGKSLLGYPKNRVGVVSSAWPDARYDLLALVDCYAISYCMTLCSRIGAEPVLVSSSSVIADVGDCPATIITIGGPTVNPVTGSMLREHCPGFVTHGEALPDDPTGRLHYSIGPQSFRDTADVGYAFIGKLAPDLTHLEGTVVMVWGHTGFGTAVAANIVNQRTREISTHGSKSFFLALKVSKVLNHRSAGREIIDVSEHAFSGPGVAGPDS